MKAGWFSNLALGQQCAWTVPGDFSVPECDNTIHCWEGSENCDASNVSPETKKYKSELLSPEEVESGRFVWYRNSSELSSHDVLPETFKYPADFSWCNKDSENYCTPSVNQYIPQYCVSCWTQASMSIMTDRIKIARGAKCMEIQLSVQNYVISAEREHCTQSCDVALSLSALDMLSASLTREYEFLVVFLVCVRAHTRYTFM